MFVEVFLSVWISSYLWLLEENELGFQVTVVLVVYDWTLDREMYAIHERFAIGAKIAVRVAFSKLLLSPFDSILLLFSFLLLSLLNYPNVRLL